MKSDYVRKIHYAMQEQKEKTILVDKLMLSIGDEELIKELAEIYNKTIILGTTKEIIFNNDKNIFIVNI